MHSGILAQDEAVGEVILVVLIREDGAHEATQTEVCNRDLVSRRYPHFRFSDLSILVKGLLLATLLDLKSLFNSLEPVRKISCYIARLQGKQSFSVLGGLSSSSSSLLALESAVLGHNIVHRVND